MLISQTVVGSCISLIVGFTPSHPLAYGSPPQEGTPSGVPCCAKGRNPGPLLEERAIKRVEPQYHRGTQKAGLVGNVVVELVIDEGGVVESARALDGPKHLKKAALAAAKQWRFVPFELDGKPAKLVGTITLRFRPHRGNRNK